MSPILAKNEGAAPDSLPGCFVTPLAAFFFTRDRCFGNSTSLHSSNSPQSSSASAGCITAAWRDLGGVLCAVAFSFFFFPGSNWVLVSAFRIDRELPFARLDLHLGARSGMPALPTAAPSRATKDGRGRDHGHAKRALFPTQLTYPLSFVFRPRARAAPRVV